MLPLVLGLGGGCDLPSSRNYDEVSISIFTRHKGVSEEVMEERVTKIIVDAVTGIDAVARITGSTENGVSYVHLDLEGDCDENVVFQNVRDRMAQVAGQLPIWAKARVQMYYVKQMESKGDDHPTTLLMRNAKSASFKGSAQ